MVSFSSLIVTVLEIYAFKFRKQGIFLGKFHPYEISESGDKFLSFQNWYFSSCFAISPEPLGQNSSFTSFWEANLNTKMLR